MIIHYGGNGHKCVAFEDLVACDKPGDGGAACCPVRESTMWNGSDDPVPLSVAQKAECLEGGDVVVGDVST